MVYYLNALYLSLFSKDFYAEIIAKGKPSGLIYIMLVSLVVSLPVSLNSKRHIAEIFDFDAKNTSAEAYSAAINSQFPELSYNNGKFEFDINEIRDISIQNDNSFIIIDPNDELKSFSKFPDSLILKPEKLLYNYKNVELQIFTPVKVFESFEPYFLRSDNGYVFDSKRFFNDLSYFISFSYPIILFLVFLITASKYIIWVFLFSNIAYLLFNLKLKNISIPSRTIFRICCFTITPVALFELVRVVFSIENLFLYPVIIGAIINIIYINYVIENFKLTLKR
ncbi:MAG TPA: hypothetical protein DIV86_04615 [Alphaproteobacteria bacterium]|nr:hypothetical protein [Alphaproteobacteria bacterium]